MITLFSLTTCMSCSLTANTGKKRLCSVIDNFLTKSDLDSASSPAGNANDTSENTHETNII